MGNHDSYSDQKIFATMGTSFPRKRESRKKSWIPGQARNDEVGGFPKRSPAAVSKIQ